MAVCGKCIHKNVCELCQELELENVVRANDFNCKDYISADDVVEVKHGKWIENIENGCTVAGVQGGFAVGYKCSVCGKFEMQKEPYCNCGAKMDGGKAE